jgi:DNA uptake protein ComE-like DNA-binding protein
MKNIVTKITGFVVIFLLVTGPASAQVGDTRDVLNPNVSGEEELAALPHMNADLAKQVVDGRFYASMLELDELLSASLSSEQRAELYVRMFVPLNLNTASKEEMLLAPGVGDRMAYEFDEYRPYIALAQFHRAIDKYVDDDELARLEQFVFVPINLNTASDEDILTIPGLGSRMLREFKEYRPYTNIEQFRREMGKYVNDEEVARLERYVTIETE